MATSVSESGVAVDDNLHCSGKECPFIFGALNHLKCQAGILDLLSILVQP